MRIPLSKIKKVLNITLENYKLTLIIVESSEISESDKTFIVNLLKTRPHKLSTSVKVIMNCTSLHLCFYMELKTTFLSEETDNGIKVVPVYDNFLSEFCTFYSTSEKVCKIFVVDLLKVAVKKMSDTKNPEFLVSIMNFFMAIHATGDKKTLELFLSLSRGFYLSRSTEIFCNPFSTFYQPWPQQKYF